MTTKSTSPSDEGEGEERAAGFVLFHSSPNGVRYLLLQHQDEDYWAFPKGRLEAGERDLEAAIREVGEETNIRRIRPIAGFRRTTRYRFTRDGRTVDKTVVYYLGEALDVEVTLSSEHRDYRWTSRDEAADVLTYEKSRNVLDAAHRCLIEKEGA